MAGGAAIACTVSSALALGSSAAIAKRGSASSPIRCPKKAQAALPLPPDAVAKAAEAALRQAAASFKATNVAKARILISELGAYEGSFLARQCGKRVQKRTVIVTLRFPAMLPSAALSQGTAFVSRFKQGYEVWEVSPIG